MSSFLMNPGAVLDKLSPIQSSLIASLSDMLDGNLEAAGITKHDVNKDALQTFLVESAVDELMVKVPAVIETMVTLHGAPHNATDTEQKIVLDTDFGMREIRLRLSEEIDPYSIDLYLKVPGQGLFGEWSPRRPPPRRQRNLQACYPTVVDPLIGVRELKVTFTHEANGKVTSEDHTLVLTVRGVNEPEIYNTAYKLRNAQVLRTMAFAARDIGSDMNITYGDYCVMNPNCKD